MWSGLVGCPALMLRLHQPGLVLAYCASGRAEHLDALLCARDKAAYFQARALMFISWANGAAKVLRIAM
jgi:hypothetical protein